MLAGWAGTIKRFVKVMPRDYKRMLAAIDAASRDGLGGESALMAAFELNNRDLARVSGSSMLTSQSAVVIGYVLGLASHIAHGRVV